MSVKTANKHFFNFAAVVVAAAIGGYYSFYVDPKLGLDLKGGVSVLLEAEDSNNVKVNAQSMKQLSKTLEKRVDSLGVAEPSIQIVNANRILVEIPGVSNTEEAIELIGRTALLEFKILDEDNILGDTLMTGAEIKFAQTVFDNENKRVVSFELTEKGRKKFHEITKNNVGSRLAIVLDGKIESAPGINMPISDGKATISSNKSYPKEEADELVLLLNSGSLPVNINVIEVRSVSATLGEESIAASLKSGKVAALMVSFFMMLWYFLAGLIATLTLAIFGLIAFGAMNFIEATFTLPGLAGFILSLGMAVDANVIIFEMIKEELRNGSTILASIDRGFKKAYSSILDSNITTLMIAYILFIFGTGPIKGYSIALGIGIFASMFTAIFATQVLLTAFVKTFGLRRPINFGFQGIRFDFDLIRYRFVFLWFALLSVSFSSFLLVNKGFNYGIDFNGGNLFSLKFDQEIDEEVFMKSLEGFEKETKYRVQFSSSENLDGRDIAIIKTSELDGEVKEKFLGSIREEYSDFDLQREEVIGAAVGQDLKKNALLALIFGALLIALYISIRFEIKFAFAAIVALIHDVIISMGLISYLGLEVNSPFIVAILTILGYSINDTVVVFDRLRENRNKVRDNLREVINRSFNEVFTRSLNTSFTTFLSLLALLWFSGDSLSTFLTTFLAGIVSGTYSSLFVASSLIYSLDRENVSEKI